MTDYALVLTNRHADRQWTLNANDYETLTMLDGGDKPTQASLDAAWPSVAAEIAATANAKAAAFASARAKLAALGLTEAEIKALVG